jgi:hypothetical protein
MVRGDNSYERGTRYRRVTELKVSYGDNKKDRPYNGVVLCVPVIEDGERE